jgi:hypothetical protein
MRSLFYLLSLFLLCVTTVSASLLRNRALVTRTTPTTEDTSNWTNARRMARGLGPARPRNLFSPTRVRRDPVASASPSTTAFLQVRRTPQDPILGYIDVDNGKVVPTKQQDADAIQFKSLGYTGELVEFDLVGMTSMHAALSTTSDTYDSNGFLTIRSTALSTGLGEVQKKQGQSWIETTVWKVQPDTGRVTALWVKPDGQYASTVFVLQSDGQLRLYYTLPAGATEVRVFIERVPPIITPP